MARSEPSRCRSRRLALGATIALALPFGVACNSLIGLSDFEKGQCAGARCPDEGGLVDQLVEGGTDAPVDALPDGKGADPVSWAKWRMPNYIDPDAGPGQPTTNGSLTAGAEIVVDNLTGLTWRSMLVAGTFAEADVEAECRKITGGPWRAPKRIELVTLLDYSRTSPFVDTTKFIDLSLDTVWTTSEVRPFVAGPEQAYWVVNFGTGVVGPLKATTKARVLCVQANK
jgi:hypothetical protein